MKKFIGGVILGGIGAACAVALSSYAEKKPELKAIKDKIKNARKQHCENQKEIFKDIWELISEPKIQSCSLGTEN